MGVVLFVVGVLIVPAFHSLHLDHCDAEGGSGEHNPETCAICTVAATALVVACVRAPIASVRETSQTLNLPDTLVSDTLISESHLARAPPAA